MTRAVADLSRQFYCAGMRAFALNFLTLVAVLLMPFGMTAAPAAAASAEHHSPAMMQHCPEQAPKHGGKAGFVECTMACAAALPAFDEPSDEPALKIPTPSAR